MNLKDMKTINRLTAALAGVMCLTLVSCSKESRDAYSDYVWCGEFPVQTENGTTGEREDHTGTIMLQFLHGGNECILDTGITGLFAVNRRKFEVRWSEKDQFALYSYSGNQSLHEYSGTIKNETMDLQALNCDGIAATYALSRIPLRE